MQDITVTFSSSELGFLRVAVDSERSRVQDLLDDGKVAKSEVKDALRAVEVYGSIINKIDTALPDTTYEYVAHKS